MYFFLIEKDIWPYQRYDQTQNNRYSENKRRIHAIKLQVEKDQKNADRLAEEQMKQAQEMVFNAQAFARTIQISICWVDLVETGIFSIQSIFTAYLDSCH